MSDSIPAKYYDEEKLICAVPLAEAESYGQTPVDAEYVEVDGSPVEKPSDETPTNYTPAGGPTLRSVEKPRAKTASSMVPPALRPIGDYVANTSQGRKLIINQKNGAVGYEDADIGMSYPMDPDQHVVLAYAAKGKPSFIGIEDDGAGMSYAVKAGEVEIVPADPKKKSAKFYSTIEGALVAAGKDEPESAPVKALLAGHCELCGKPLDEPANEVPVDAAGEIAGTEEEFMGPSEEVLGNPVEVVDVNQGSEPTAKVASESTGPDQPAVVVAEAATNQPAGTGAKEIINGKMVTAYVVGETGASVNSGARPEAGTVIFGLATQPGFTRVVAGQSEPQLGTSGLSSGNGDRLASLGRGEIHPVSLSAKSEPGAILGVKTLDQGIAEPQSSPAGSILVAVSGSRGNGSKNPRAATPGNSATDGATRLDDAVLEADARTADASNVVHAGQRPVHATAGDARGAAGDNADSHDLARKFDASLNTVQGQGNGADSNMHGEGDDRGLEIASAVAQAGDNVSPDEVTEVDFDGVFEDSSLSSPSIYS